MLLSLRLSNKKGYSRVESTMVTYTVWFARIAIFASIDNTHKLIIDKQLKHSTKMFTGIGH